VHPTAVPPLELLLLALPLLLLAPLELLLLALPLLLLEPPLLLLPAVVVSPLLPLPLLLEAPVLDAPLPALEEAELAAPPLPVAAVLLVDFVSDPQPLARAPMAARAVKARRARVASMETSRRPGIDAGYHPTRQFDRGRRGSCTFRGHSNNLLEGPRGIGTSPAW
jgi:hypothetical protein